MQPRLASVSSIFVLLCTANILSYVFRGVVPAAPVEFQAFIQRTLNVPSDETSFYFGLLESVFIGTYSLSIVVFGYLSKTVRPFRLLAVGLSLWCASVVLCGVAAPANSFYVLLVGRVLSGVGDASIQALTPPFIERHAAPERKNLWMGLYYATVAVGMGLSYFYGSAVARSWGWQWAFYMCAMAMAPLVPLSLVCIPDAYNRPLVTASSSTFRTDLATVVQNIVFLSSSLGGAAFAFTFTGLATFAPAILIGAGTFPAAWSSTIFGLFIVVTGMVGAPLAGFLLDRAIQGHEDDDSFRLHAACRHQLLHVLVGFPFLVATTWCLSSPVGFLCCLAIGLTSSFGTMNATTIAVMLSVPPALHGLAIGLFTTIIHWAGDVPAPVVIGLVKDAYAPGCGSVVGSDGVDHLSPECFTDANRFGLKMTLFWSIVWLVWCILLWVLSWWAAKRQPQHEGYVQDVSSDEAVVVP
ncbi:Aste57867_3220 [Aphanomyces stellatus]|uniref:Aste57867_3220 protein n=1 Tax=Aphanomyces stellatus TaxID=120398 RepID=A0A485KBP1_9STRA|nr:hypothetical protein As57867_003210 [Aphanomyces stellatus]VFT80394.1 Aste57867_3220 [Aphanomyces stellatus]